jgi:hypothetical protein
MSRIFNIDNVTSSLLAMETMGVSLIHRLGDAIKTVENSYIASAFEMAVIDPIKERLWEIGVGLPELLFKAMKAGLLTGGATSQTLSTMLSALFTGSDVDTAVADQKTTAQASAKNAAFAPKTGVGSVVSTQTPGSRGTSTDSQTVKMGPINLRLDLTVKMDGAVMAHTLSEHGLLAGGTR